MQVETGIHPMFPDAFQYYAQQNEELVYELQDRSCSAIASAVLKLAAYPSGRSKQQADLKKKDGTVAGSLMFDVDAIFFKEQPNAM